MKAETTQIKRVRGRPVGSTTVETAKKQALKVLAATVSDETISRELRAKAALALLTGSNQ
jgi:hypothetical protein